MRPKHNVRNQYMTKIWNQELILDIIKDSDGASRTDISKQSGLSVPSISKNIENLLSKDLVYEAGLQKSSGGRKPIVVKYNYDVAFILTIGLHANSVTYSVRNLAGESHYYEKKQHHYSSLTMDDVIDNIVAVVQRMRMKFPQIACIAMSVPGIINKNQIMVSKVFPQLAGNRFKDNMEAATKLQVIICNDINVKAIGEYHKIEIPVQSLIYISPEDKGIGSGIVLGGDVLEGYSFGAGEIGYYLFEFDENKSNSQNEDLDTRLYKTEFPQLLTKIERRYNYKLINNGIIDFSALMKLAEEHEEDMEDIFSYLAKYYTMIIYNMNAILNPQRFVLGGYFSTLGSVLVERIEENLAKISRNDIQLYLASEDFDAEAAGLVYYGARHLEEKLLNS